MIVAHKNHFGNTEKQPSIGKGNSIFSTSIGVAILPNYTIMNVPSSTTSSAASSIRLNEVITLTVPTKTYDGSSSRSSLKKRKVRHVTSSSDHDQLIERLTALVLGHEEEASSDVLSINDTATRVDDVNDWDWMMGGKKDSYMLIARRLGKSGSRQGQDELRNEEWGEHSTSPVTLTPALLNHVRKHSFVARSA